MTNTHTQINIHKTSIHNNRKDIISKKEKYLLIKHISIHEKNNEAMLSFMY